MEIGIIQGSIIADRGIRWENGKSRSYHQCKVQTVKMRRFDLQPHVHEMH